MEISSQSCRICLSITEFNVSLFSNYCRKNNMVDKILVCLKLFIEETDYLKTICYRCADNIERYYEFIMNVKKSQTLFDKQEICSQRNPSNGEHSPVNHHVTSYVREQVIDADYTFSFLEMSHNDDKEAKQSSPLFSYFSPQNMLVKQSHEPVWKTPWHRLDNDNNKGDEKKDLYKRKLDKPKHLSGDIFDSQSDLEEIDFKRPEWKLTPDESLIRRVKEKCFGPSDF